MQQKKKKKKKKKVITMAMVRERETLAEEKERPWVMGMWVLLAQCV